MEAKCRFKADDSMRHTLTREHDAMFQVERKLWCNIKSAVDLPKNCTINRSLEDLAVDSIFLQLGRTNNGQSVHEITEAAQGSSSRHVG